MQLPSNVRLKNSMTDGLKFLASLKLTLTGLFLLGTGIAVIILEWLTPTIAIAPGFLVLLLNLTFAILVKEKIRYNPALLVFHLSLLCLMLLVMVSRLTYLKGWVELTEGERFTQLTGVIDAGPLHPDDFSDVAFTQGEFFTHIENGSRKYTQSHILLPDGRSYIISDQQPLDLAGYQFTLSPHIGYSLDFVWQSGFDYRTIRIHLPAYYRDSVQMLEWTLPDSDSNIMTLLEMDTSIAMQGRFKMPEDYQVVVNLNQQRIPLSLNQPVALQDGRLTFTGLQRWIGYDVFYDWTIPWLLVTCLSAILSLGFFLWQKNGGSAWDKNE